MTCSEATKETNNKSGIRSKFKKEKEMKTSMRAIFTACLFIPLFAMAASNSNSSDTVIIELEGGSKIVIYTESKADLKALENYDFNKMISDLNSSVDTSGTNYIELTDENGDKYKREARVYRDERTYAERTRDRDWDRDDRKKRRRRYYRRTRNVWNVELGTNNWLEDGNFPNDQDERYAVQPWGSWYLALNSNYRTYIGGPLLLQWGFGVSTSQFRFEDSDVRIEKGDDMVEFNIDTTGNAIRSKLRMSHLNFTMVPTLVLGDENGGSRYSRRSFRIGVGGYVGYRLGGSSKFVYDDDGDNEKDVDRDDFFLTNLRYGVRAQFGYKAFDAFINYDLNNVFAENRGPELNAFTFGVIF